MGRYVKREAGIIICSYANKQIGVAEEYLRDDNQELINFQQSIEDLFNNEQIILDEMRAMAIQNAKDSGRLPQSFVDRR